MKRILSLVVSIFILSSTAIAVETGEAAPDFTLKNTKGEYVSLSENKGKVVVLEWYNPECPFIVKHYRNGDMQKLQKKWTDKGVVWLSIQSTNDENGAYKTPAELNGIMDLVSMNSTALLVDEPGTVGKRYGAKTTPHMFVIDKAGKLVYQGAIDDTESVFSDPKKAKNYVDVALSDLEAGKPVSVEDSRPYGCSVKY